MIPRNTDLQPNTILELVQLIVNIGNEICAFWVVDKTYPKMEDGAKSQYWTFSKSWRLYEFQLM